MMNRALTRLILNAVVVALGLVLLAGCGEGRGRASGVPNENPAPPSIGAARSVETTVTRVIDGDTIAVAPVGGTLEPTRDSGADEHIVRLLGIDAPEMNHRSAANPECGAQEATDHLEQILPVSMPVTIEYDPVADRTDHFGRSLAYVTTRGGTDAGFQQVTYGYAMPWYPEGEPEPVRIPEYSEVAESAAAQDLGAHAGCETIRRD